MAPQLRIILLSMLFLAYETSGRSPEKRYISGLVDLYLNLSDAYMHMEVALNNMDLNLPDLKTFLRKQSVEKRNLAFELIDYQHMRGGNLTITHTRMSFEWPHFRTPYQVVVEFYKYEMNGKQIVVRLHNEAERSKRRDIEFSFLLCKHLQRMSKILSELRKIRNHLRRQNDGKCCPGFEHSLCTTEQRYY